MMATDPNVAYHLRDGCNGVKVRTLDITDYQLMNWSAIYHCVASVKTYNGNKRVETISPESDN